MAAEECLMPLPSLSGGLFDNFFQGERTTERGDHRLKWNQLVLGDNEKQRDKTLAVLKGESVPPEPSYGESLDAGCIDPKARLRPVLRGTRSFWRSMEKTTVEDQDFFYLVPATPQTINEKATLSHIEEDIQELQVPDSWKLQGYEDPSDGCKAMAFDRLASFFISFGLIPKATASTKDGGVMVIYRNSSRTLRIMFDNELDTTAVVTQKKEIVFSTMLAHGSINHELVEAFEGSK